MNILKALFGSCRMKILVRRLSEWAWSDMLYDVGRVEWKYGRNDNGTLKDWTEWNNVRVHLRESERLWNLQELDLHNTIEDYRKEQGE